MASPAAPVRIEPLLPPRMARFWSSGAGCVVAGAVVSLGFTGTHVTAVTVTTAPSADVVVKVVVTSLDVEEGGGVVVVGRSTVEVVNVVSGTVRHGSMAIWRPWHWGYETENREKKK